MDRPAASEKPIRSELRQESSPLLRDTARRVAAAFEDGERSRSSAKRSRVPQERDEERFDPLKLMLLLLHYRLVLAIALIVAVAGGIVFTKLQSPVYRAKAKLELSTSAQSSLRGTDASSEGAKMLSFETARQKIMSRALARKIVDGLGIADSQTFLADATASHDVEDASDAAKARRRAVAIDLVDRNLTTSLVRNTSIITIEFQHSDPVHAAMIANRAAETFMQSNVENGARQADRTRRFIETQVEKARARLQTSEQALLAYAQREGITEIGSDKSLIQQNIAQFNDLLGKATDQRILAERHVRQLERSGALSLPQIAESDTVKSAKAELAQRRAIYQQKRARLKPGFPEMRKLAAEIAELERNLAAEIATIGTGVRLAYEQAMEKEGAMRAELARLEGESRDYQQKNIRYTILKREADSDRQHYQTLIARLSETGFDGAVEDAGAEIIDEARIPTAPFSPNLIVNMIFALILGGAGAVSVIYMLELLGNTFNVPDEVEQALDADTLGVIPAVSDKKIEAEGLDPSSPFCEAYRTLRTSLSFTHKGMQLRHILVTSAGPGEGKTTTAIRLARDNAALGKKVLIVDADLRKPRVHHHLKIENGRGLGDLLSSHVIGETVSDCFRKTDTENLTALTAGALTANAGDLLAMHKTRLLLDMLSQKYDLVVIDSPPVIGLTDAPMLASMSDATLLVVACKQTRRAPAKAAMERLRAAGATVVGTALTKFSIGRFDYNQAYRHMRTDYYSYGETASQPNSQAA